MKDYKNLRRTCSWSPAPSPESYENNSHTSECSEAQNTDTIHENAYSRLNINPLNDEHLAIWEAPKKNQPFWFNSMQKLRK